jgi:hypothetical protein
MVPLVAFSISVSSAFGAAIKSHSGLGNERIVSLPMYMYKNDCFKRRPVTGLLQYVPGAGIDEFTPFETVLKDGFMEIDCVKDYMYYHGDKFGDARHAYKLEDVSNVSIVHYEDHVGKADRKPMTQATCFEFCRTVPNMGFFGLMNGRNCYCAPYYKMMAGDSSQCDAPCPGDNTLMCGGPAKSSVFALHNCESTESDLKASEKKATELAGDIDENADKAAKLGADMQKFAAALQIKFSNIGDSGAARLLQAAKVSAGKLEHGAEEAKALSAELKGLSGKAGGVSDFKDPAQVTEAELLMAETDKAVAEASVAHDKLEDKIELAEVSEPEKDASKQYYPAMYYVDKKAVGLPSTCAGDLLLDPILGDVDACATACNKNFQTCIGFSHFAPDNLCFMLSNFKSAVYYPGCEKKGEKEEKTLKFLQQGREDNPDVTCYAKVSRFESTSLAPDPSGDCKQCFREVTKRTTCYTEG